MTRILLTTDIEAPPEVCFDLCLDVDVQLSLDRGIRAVAGVTRGPLRLGDAVTWRARHFGVLWRMTSMIIEVNRPHSFVDQMQDGPFAAWQHVHTFAASGLGTRMCDEVKYWPPLGFLGRFFDAIILEAYMTRLLGSRNCRLKDMIEESVEMSRRRAEATGVQDPLQALA